jgi:hypothetical protein
MKSANLCFAIASLLLIPLATTAADINDIVGTFSGNWTPKGGVLEAFTVEFRLESGKLAGRFRTPAAMDFTKVSFDPKTGNVSLQATDAKAGKSYVLTGKLTGNDIKGSMTVGGVAGDVLLIKWTYIPR